ncbi:hypothetical protein [Maribacter halichondriae]|uniref:hypothetical protein n=1 Tax=Maribacter halichondriae TaxID=2980554 RepID=UPI0023597BB6|nr:hypothetical protein [Maribacter sp. Hal144]
MTSWLALHGLLAYFGFYQNLEAVPPRIFLAFAPTLLLIIALFATSSGRKWMNDLDLKTLTLLHGVRIPVEFVLYWLFLNKVVPELMTYEGRNFDILAGITAPFVYYFGFVKSKIGRKGILFWNIVCLLLLLNIIINAILSAPLPFQQFAFDQPNIAILYFPMVWLPALVVPIVLFSHLVAISRLVKESPKKF